MLLTLPDEKGVLNVIKEECHHLAKVLESSFQ